MEQATSHQGQNNGADLDVPVQFDDGIFPPATF